MANNQKYSREDLIAKFYKGIATEEELKMLFQQVRKDPTPPDLLVIERIWLENEQQPELNEEISGHIFSKVLDKIDFEERSSKVDSLTTTVVNNRILTRTNLNRWIGIAAGFLTLVTLSMWILWKESSKAVIQTAYGEQQTLELSDGSKIKLNANSQVVFETQWSNEDHREVWLEGEAFFDVLKNPKTRQAFRVNTDDVVIEVLGTAFNVNNHGDKTSVYLEEGAVRLFIHELDTTIMMQPGDLIIYSKLTREIINKHQVQTELHTSWKNGVLFFRDSPLLEVLEKIEETYGVDFEVVNSNDYLREINFPLPIDELETAISILNKTMVDLEIRKVGERYIIE